MIKAMCIRFMGLWSFFVTMNVRRIEVLKKMARGTIKKTNMMTLTAIARRQYGNSSPMVELPEAKNSPTAESAKSTVLPSIVGSMVVTENDQLTRREMD